MRLSDGTVSPSLRSRYHKLLQVIPLSLDRAVRCAGCDGLPAANFYWLQQASGEAGDEDCTARHLTSSFPRFPKAEFWMGQQGKKKKRVLNVCKIALTTLTLLQWDFCTDSTYTRAWWYFHLIFINESTGGQYANSFPQKSSCLRISIKGRIVSYVCKYWILTELEICSPFSQMFCLLSNTISIINSKVVTMRNSVMNINLVVLF